MLIISRCNYGYRLIGSQERICLPISLWGGLPSYCKRKYFVHQIKFEKLSYLTALQIQIFMFYKCRYKREQIISQIYCQQHQMYVRTTIRIKTLKRKICVSCFTKKDYKKRLRDFLYIFLFISSIIVKYILIQLSNVLAFVSPAMVWLYLKIAPCQEKDMELSVLLPAIKDLNLLVQQ